MSKTLRLLLVEDSPADAELAVATLDNAGYSCQWQRVDKREDFLKRLKDSEFDLVLTDYSLPSFDGLSAVKLFIEHNLDIPIIHISGTLGEEAAVESLKAGATDFVLKDKMFRLPYVVNRALQEKEEQRRVRQAEQQIRLQAAALESAANAIVITDREGKITFVNQAFTTLTGYTPDEVLSQNPRILKSDRHPDTLYKDLWETVLSGQVWHGELVNRRKDGSLYTEEQTITPVTNGRHEITNFIAVKQDISERKHAELERKVLFDIIQGVIITPNLDEFLKLVHRSIGRVIYAENCFVMLHDTMNNLNHFEFWVDKYDPVPSPRPPGKGFSSYVLRTGRPLLLTRESGKKMVEQGEAEKIGTLSPSWLGVPLRTTEHPIGVMVLQHYDDEQAFNQRDLEFLSSVGDQIALAIERKRSEEALGDSEERYRNLIENAIDIIYTHDLEGNYTSINKAAERITGYTAEETLKLNVVDSVAPEYREKAKEMIATKLADKGVKNYEVEILGKDGHRITVEVNTRIVSENNIPVGVQGIARDVTERKQLEEQFRQAQKMEAIGVLAGGVAHDFNNLLTAINGYSDLTLKSMSVDNLLRHNIEEIKAAGDRATALTSQLLAFSRKQVLSPRVHNLNTVIIEIEKMLRRIIKESIELRTVLAPDLGNIKADPGQMEQVIMNLAVNARDAMPNGGTLTIETQNATLEEDYVDKHPTATAGRFIRMIITDTGSGMDESLQQHIFDPFFTTKPLDKGTGLGLSTVHGIVKQSGGNIRVYSEVGQGTTFKIYLPRVDEIVQKRKWVDDRDEDLLGTETVLLVEDDDMVRNLVNRILRSNGYYVLEANSGKAALSICETYSEGIHLLLSDVVMPKMSGLELRNQLIKLRPDIKVLFMSGYTDDSMTQNEVLDADTAFIEKPFTPDGLAKKIREILTM